MKKYEDLNPADLALIGECLRAAAFGPFFIDLANTEDPYWEIHSLFGLTIDELRQTAEAWPQYIGPNTSLAVRNTLGNLLGYPHGIKGENWSKWLSCSMADIERIRQSLT